MFAPGAMRVNEHIIAVAPIVITLVSMRVYAYCDLKSHGFPPWYSEEIIMRKTESIRAQAAADAVLEALPLAKAWGKLVGRVLSPAPCQNFAVIEGVKDPAKASWRDWLTETAAAGYEDAEAKQAYTKAETAWKEATAQADPAREALTTAADELTTATQAAATAQAVVDVALTMHPTMMASTGSSSQLVVGSVQQLAQAELDKARECKAAADAEVGRKTVAQEAEKVRAEPVLAAEKKAADIFREAKKRASRAAKALSGACAGGPGSTGVAPLGNVELDLDETNELELEEDLDHRYHDGSATFNSRPAVTSLQGRQRLDGVESTPSDVEDGLAAHLKGN